METSIVGRDVRLSDRFRDHAISRSARVSDLSGASTSLHIKVTRRNSKANASGREDHVALTATASGTVVRAEASDPDKYAALETAFARLREQLRRAKDRDVTQRRRGLRPRSARRVMGRWRESPITMPNSTVPDRPLPAPWC